MAQISHLHCSIRVRMPSDNLVRKSWLWWLEKMLPPLFFFPIYSGRKSRSVHAASCENLWELFSYCRASGSVAVIICLLLELANGRHSLFSQVSIYIWPVLSCIFMLHRRQPFPEALLTLQEGACVSWASDGMICLSPLISFLLAFGG